MDSNERNQKENLAKIYKRNNERTKVKLTGSFALRTSLNIRKRHVSVKKFDIGYKNYYHLL